MRRRHSRTLARLFTQPVSGNIPWQDVEVDGTDDRQGCGFEYSQMAGKPRSKTLNLMSVDGYRARIAYDPEIDLFRGEILGLNGSADFYGRSPAELKREFRQSLKVFLEVCEEKGLPPRKVYSGRFNLRIPSELHEEIAVHASSEDLSINQWVANALKQTLVDRSG
jgi:predicted HicB family RNase H-like nuclease